MPIILANRDYSTEKNDSFLKYINDVLIAVEVKDERTLPLFKDGKILLVEKSETNYEEKVRANSNYLNHPEEVLAENFSFWVTDEQVKNREPVEKLIEVMKSIK